MLSPKTITTPTVDKLNSDFKYIQMGGSRGVYDELMWFQWYPQRRIDEISPVEPHRIPIMLGAAFAIRRDYFTDIGMYDDGW